MSLECRLTGSSTTPLLLACREKDGAWAVSGHLADYAGFEIGAGDASGPKISGWLVEGPALRFTGFWQLDEAGSTYLLGGGGVALAICDEACNAPPPAWQVGLPESGRSFALSGHEQPSGSYGRGMTVRGRISGPHAYIDELHEYVSFEGARQRWDLTGAVVDLTADELAHRRLCL
jgi:hypothetical protein